MNEQARIGIFVLYAILLLFIFPAPAHSMQVNSYSISSEISVDSGVRQKIIIVLKNDGASEMGSASFSVSADSQILSISDNYGALLYSAEKGRATNVLFNFSRPLEANGTRLVIIELEADGLVKNKGEYFEYLLVFTPKQNITGFEHFLKLPPGAMLFSPKDFDIVFPEAEVSHNGGTATVRWSKNLVAGQPEVFLARYRTESAGSEFLYAAVIIVAISVLVSFSRKPMKTIKDKRTAESQVKSLNLLNEREKAIVELIIKNEGIRQNELKDVLGYTKSSLSKIISRLEMRRIIERKKYGKINKLYAGEKLKQ